MFSSKEPRAACSRGNWIWERPTASWMLPQKTSECRNEYPTIVQEVVSGLKGLSKADCNVTSLHVVTRRFQIRSNTTHASLNRLATHMASQKLGEKEISQQAQQQCSDMLDQDRPNSCLLQSPPSNHCDESNLSQGPTFKGLDPVNSICLVVVCRIYLRHDLTPPCCLL